MTAEPRPAYKRVLLKLSGEALMGEQTYGIDPAVANQIALDVAEIQGMGVETAIVIGGGNIFRGVAASARGMDRATADYMGMLGTVINALALQDALEQQAEDKPENVRSRIAEGKLRKWMEEVVLLKQPHVNQDKYGGKTIEELRTNLSGTTGENVVIRRFSRFAVGA